MIKITQDVYYISVAGRFPLAGQLDRRPGVLSLSKNTLPPTEAGY